MLNIGSLLPLNLVLEDGAQDKYPVAHVFDQDGVEVLGSPFNLTHTSLGYYKNTQYIIKNTDSRLVAIYIVYDDSSHTEESYFYVARTSEVFEIGSPGDGPNSSIFLELSGIVDSDDMYMPGYYP